MLERIQETAAFLKGKMHTQPETAIILGTGLGSLAGEITEKYEIRYEEIPNFPVSTVEGHSGKLIFGKLGHKDIMAMQGRWRAAQSPLKVNTTEAIRYGMLKHLRQMRKQRSTLYVICHCGI